MDMDAAKVHAMLCDTCPHHDNCRDNDEYCSSYILAFAVVVLGGPED